MQVYSRGIRVPHAHLCNGEEFCLEAIGKTRNKRKKVYWFQMVFHEADGVYGNNISKIDFFEVKLPLRQYVMYFWFDYSWLLNGKPCWEVGFYFNGKLKSKKPTMKTIIEKMQTAQALKEQKELQAIAKLSKSEIATTAKIRPL